MRKRSVFSYIWGLSSAVFLFLSGRIFGKDPQESFWFLGMAILFSLWEINTNLRSKNSRSNDG